MNKKCQAGLEFMAITAIILIFTVSLNDIFFKLNYNILKGSETEVIVSKCLDFILRI